MLNRLFVFELFQLNVIYEHFLFFSPFFSKTRHQPFSKIPSTKKDTHFERFLPVFAHFSPCDFSGILSINS